MTNLDVPRFISLSSVGSEPILTDRDVDRVLAAVGRPLAAGEVNRPAVRTILEQLSFDFVRACFGTQTSKKDVDTLERSITNLLAILAKLRTAYFPPARPPAAYIAYIERWIAAERAHLAELTSGGRPPNVLDRYALPRLLGFYQFAFGRKPATTRDGPTVAFVKAYLTEMSQVLASAEFESSVEAMRIRRLWTVPNTETIRSRIRATLKSYSEYQNGSPLVDLIAIYIPAHLQGKNPPKDP